MATAITVEANHRAGRRRVARVRQAKRASLLCLILAWLWLACAPALGAPHYACGSHGGETIARSPQVRVFIRGSTYYSCWLPKRKRTRLGIESENDLPENSGGVSTPVHTNGQYVVWAIEGVAEGGEEAIVSVLNARTGRIVRELEVPQEYEPVLVSSVTDVGVAADGSLVYLQLEGSPCPGNHTHGAEHNRNEALVAYEPGNHQHLLECEVDSDPEFSITHLRVVGQTVSWTHAGVAHAVALR
jgi:hypothetical protein